MDQQPNTGSQERNHLQFTSILKYGIAAVTGAVATLIIILIVTNIDIKPPLSTQLPGIANLAPTDATEITIWDLEQLRQGNYLEIHPDAPSPEHFMESQMLYLQQTPAVDPYELTQYLLFQRQGWQPVELATGPMDFQYMELELEDAGYKSRSYRGYEIWTGQVTYAFLPDHSYVVGSQDEDTVKAFLNHFHRRNDLDQDDDELPIPMVLDHNGQGPATTAQRGRQNCPISRCQALAVTLSNYDEEEGHLNITFTLLFRNEVSAEKAAWDYDDVASHMESKFHIEVTDMASNGRFVTGDATGGTNFFRSLR